MDGKPTPLREPTTGITIAQRFQFIQSELKQLLEGVDSSIRSHMLALMTECDAAQEYPLPAGQKEEYRQIALALRASVERLNALGMKK